MLNRKINFLKSKTDAKPKHEIEISDEVQPDIMTEWDLIVENNVCETPLFEIPILWHAEALELYDYKEHKTKIKSEDLNYFIVKGSLGNGEELFRTLDSERLFPITYLLNYEELIGLFNVDNLGGKHYINNYENKFIDSNAEISKLVKSFCFFIAYSKNLSHNDISKRVSEDAEKLWKLAVKSVQSGILDDRPLYWARNKMQVMLKRHPIFKDDIDFSTSQVKKNTKLSKLIVNFEEKSRNYTGIDFSKAPAGSKKVLITGFDPFILNQFDNDYLKSVSSPNILQSNPSGIVALALANSLELGAYIQTMVVPVRYEDFDGSQEHDKGQGEGIIEKYIKHIVIQADMIVTVSQFRPNKNVIDKFGTATRGGFNDNQDFTRVPGSHALTTSDEWIETTLPKEFTNAPFVIYNWEFDYIPNITKSKPTIGQKLNQGSGGDYLSNEIFYRVAKMRNELCKDLSTGHFHISKIQSKGKDLDLKLMSDLLKIVKKGIEEGLKGI